MSKKLLFVVYLALLFGIMNISANAALTCGFQAPSASGSSLGNLSLINVSYSDSGATTPTRASYTVSVNISSPSTRNSSSVSSIFDIANTTGGTMAALFSVNSSFPNSIIVEDSTDYTLACSCRNNTDAVNCNATLTSTLVDRTSPSPPTAITFTNPLQDGNTITATIDRTLANRCWILFGGAGVPRRAMTLSGSTCTFTVAKDTPPNSDYQTFVQADDRTNTTNSAVQSITIRGTPSGGGGLYGANIEIDNSQGQSVIGGQSNPFAPKKNNDVFVWAVLAFVAFLLFKGKK